jgi:hypothetical protein
LEGRTLTVHEGFGNRVYTLGPQSRAYAGFSQALNSYGPSYGQASILIVDAAGQEVAIPVMQAPGFQEDVVRRINAYLAASR